MILNVNATSRYLSIFKAQVPIGNLETAEEFRKAMQKPYGQTKEIPGGHAKLETEPMDMVQYKQYIQDRIARIPMDPSQSMADIAVDISDAGLEAMKADPDYEAWVLDTLKKDFLTYDPWANICGGSYTIHHFGASKEEYRGEGWRAGYEGGRGQEIFDEKSEDNFWQRRRKKDQEAIELSKKKMKKEKLLEKLRLQQLKIGPDGKKTTYLAGVSAEELLSMLLP